MKSLLAALLTVVSLSANAQSAPDQQTLLKELLGSKAKQASQGDRWVQFADSNGAVEVANVQKAVSLTVRNGDSEISETLIGDESNVTTLEKIDQDTNLITVDSYADEDGKHQVFQTTKFRITKFGGDLEVEAERTTTLDFTFDGKDSHLATLATPKVEKVRAGGKHLLTLSQTAIDKLGVIVKKHMKNSDRRQLGGGECSVKSAYIMECQWYLATDYSPDTIHATVSLKDGKVSEILNTEFEPGC